MRHRKQGRKLGRTASHRKALRRNLALSLFIHERITTTTAKAKEARRLAERMITLAKDGSVYSRRRAFSFLQDRDVVDKLFDEIAPRYRNREGGYTRILHLDKNRLGDNAPQVLFELVGEEEEAAAKPKAAPKAAKADAKPAAEAPKAAEKPADAEAKEQAKPADEPPKGEEKKAD